MHIYIFKFYWAFHLSIIIFQFLSNLSSYNININFYLNPCISFSYKPQVEEFGRMCQEDKANWDAIIQEAKDAGATEEMIKELGAYERQDNIYDDMAKWVNCLFFVSDPLMFEIWPFRPKIWVQF